MAKRRVTLLTPYRVGTEVNIVRIDKYGNRVDDVVHTLRVDEDSKVTLELDVPENSDYYYMFVEQDSNNDGRQEDFFWVSEGVEEEVIDMRLSFREKSLPTFLNCDLNTSAINGDRVLGYEWCKSPIESLEDRRFLCRYGDFLEGKRDLEVCEIDEQMRDNFKGDE